MVCSETEQEMYRSLCTFLDNNIKHDGKMKNQNLKQHELEDLKHKLRLWLENFRAGKGPIYLPLTAELTGFRATWLFLQDKDSADAVYAEIKNLLEDLVKLEVPIPVHRASIEKCVEAVSFHMMDKAATFTSRYLSVNRLTIIQILDLLDYLKKSQGVRELVEAAIVYNRLTDVYERCKGIRLTVSKHDTLAKRLYALFRTYDNLLVILGAAAHQPLSFREMKFHRGRSGSYTLFSTPLTRSLKFILTRISLSDVADYVSALRDLVQVAVSSVHEDLVLASTRAKRVLESYRHIDVDTSDDIIRRTIVVVRHLLSTL